MVQPNYDWYERVEENLMELLFDECEMIADYIEDYCRVKFNKAAKHPSIEIIDVSEDEEPIIDIHFDPFNQQFYVKQAVKSSMWLILDDIEDILEVIHTAMHLYLDNHIGDWDHDEDDEAHIDLDEVLNSPLNPLYKKFLELDEEGENSYDPTTENVNWITDEFITEEFRRDSQNNEEEFPQITGSNTHIRIGERRGKVIIIKGNTTSLNHEVGFKTANGPVFEINPDEVDVLIDALNNYKEIKRDRENDQEPI